MPKIIAIPPEREFRLPEGNYRATLCSVTEPKWSQRHPNGTGVRLGFTVTIPSLRNTIPSAARNFDATLARGSELRQFLEMWLGPDFHKSQGERPFDLELLVGTEADLSLIHIKNGSHKHPFVYIQSAHQPGKLRLTESPATKPIADTDRIVALDADGEEAIKKAA